MADFDVFISYAHDDRTIATAACSILESSGLRCWMAPRDIPPGADYAEALNDALDRCRAFVLIFSGRANESQHIRREVERAVSRAIPLIPVRVEDIQPSAALRYFVQSVHWLDAITPPVESHFEQLATRLLTLLERPIPLQPTVQPSPPAPAVVGRRTARARWAVLGTLAIGGMLCVLSALLRDTPSLMIGMGALAANYGLVYRNIPGDPVMARTVLLLLTGVLAYFILSNLMFRIWVYAGLEVLDLAFALYALRQIHLLVETRRPNLKAG